jgi:hypothetical protein
VTEDLGRVKIDSSVSPVIVPLEVTSISPATGLNPFGGNIVTITGKNFPTSLLEARYNL